MEKREWKPGAVALLKYIGEEPSVSVRVTDCRMHEGATDHWHTQRGTTADGSLAEWVRPLVVIDPEDREQVERLSSALAVATEPSARCQHPTDAMQAALREFANPTPPKPDEPTGLGAVVEAEFRDDEGKGFGPAHWAKAGDGTWLCLTDGITRTAAMWPFLTNVRVLSEGVTG